MQFTDVHTPRSALNKMLILLQNDSAPLMASSNQQQLKYQTCSKNCPTKNELAVYNNKTLNIPKKCRTKWKPRCSVVYLTQASRAKIIYTLMWVSYTIGHIQEQEIYSVVCDQEAVKQYSPSDTQILQKRNATWVGMVCIANTSKQFLSFLC